MDKIKEWILLDNEIKNASMKLRELREKQQNIESILFKIPEFQEKNIQINSTEKIKIGNCKSYQSLTFKYLENILSKIIKNESQCNVIFEQIKNSREVKMVPSIKRFSIN